MTCPSTSQIAEPVPTSRDTVPRGGSCASQLSRGRWAAPTAALGGFLLVGLVVLVASVLAPGSTDPVAVDGPAVEPGRGPGTSDASDPVAEYAGGMQQVARAAATIIELEMKPAMTQIVEDGLDHGVDTSTWAGEFESLRTGLADQVPPPHLADAHAGFLAALDGYTQAAHTLHRAATTADPQARQRLLDQVGDLGRTADDHWDRAWEQLSSQTTTIPGADHG